MAALNSLAKALAFSNQASGALSAAMVTNFIILVVTMGPLSTIFGAIRSL